MRHHKYACCFVLYRGIYDSEMTVFTLSEVIYLSSAVTVGMNKAEDNYTARRLDIVKLWVAVGDLTAFTNLTFKLNIVSEFCK